MAYRILADMVLGLHALFVLFVIGGLVAVLVGVVLDWSWVRNPWIRLAHLCAIAVVVLQTWWGAVCPLTIWEQQFRERAGQATYAGGFVSHWLHELLFYDAPHWVFTICYTGFAALVLLCWFLAPPRSFHRHRE